MFHFAVLVSAILLGFPAGSSADNPVSDVDKAIRQCRSFLLEEHAADAAQAVLYAESQSDDGSWPDMDYSSKDRSGWPPSIHVDRVLSMAAFCGQASSTAQRASVIESIHRALAYWRQNDFKCPNWWHNRIGVPRKLCEIAILLGEESRSEELDYLQMCVTTRSKVGDSTAQNRVWLAGINLMYGLIRRDEELIQSSASTIFAEVEVARSREGIQSDYSFHQHGPQLQFGNYGTSFVLDQIRWWTVLQGTKWAMPESRMLVLRRYILDGLNWVVWKGFLDISCCGRALAPDVQTSRAARIAAAAGRAAMLDSSESESYRSFVRRNAPEGDNDLVGCRYFWRSDYLVYRRKDFCATLKMCSARVKGAESLNGQNLSGYYLADGVTYYYRRGDEYKDIFPLWNWRMLPGVTCAQQKGPMPRFGSYKLDSEFVGGVSDGMNGCAALDYRRDGVSARKAWFFAGDQVICLGAGIRADEKTTSPVATTVNQCLLRGVVRIGDGKVDTERGYGVQVFTGLQWVEHDGLRYSFPSAQGVKLSIQKRTGNWSEVANTPSMPKEDAAGSVFALSIEHGARPTDASYAYVVSPAGDAAGPHYSILSNTPELQAARFGDDIVGAVFYEPGRLEYAEGRSIRVGAPCLVLIEISGAEPVVRVADPTKKLTSLEVEVGGKKFAVGLPSEGEAGKSVVVR